jgi:hypothetical protein
VLRSVIGAGMGWDAGRGGVGCDASVGAGVAAGHPGASPSVILKKHFQSQDEQIVVEL